MRLVVDKVTLLVLGFILILPMDRQIVPVLSLLAALIAAALGIYIENRKIKACLLISYIVGCLFLPELCAFLPVIFYDCAGCRYYWGVIGIIPFIMFCQSEGNGKIISWIVISILALWFEYETRTALELKNKLIYIRDTSTEMNMLLKEKNKNLMEKQDYEIYLATLKERNRIAREIHDNVGHMLSRSILQIGALTTIHKEEPLHNQLVSVNETLNNAMNSIRESVHDLHDNSVDLRQAVLDATKEISNTYKVTLDYDMTLLVPPNIKYCFISIVKEAMANIVKHSNADRIVIILREHPALYQLSIEDNGTNLEQSVFSDKSGVELDFLNIGGGIGLVNMKERVEALHGTFHIHTEQGFQIFVSIRKTED